MPENSQDDQDSKIPAYSWFKLLLEALKELIDEIKNASSGT